MADRRREPLRGAGRPVPRLQSVERGNDPPDDSRIFVGTSVRTRPLIRGCEAPALRASSTAFRGFDVPTNLPAQPPRPSHAFALFAALIALSLFAIEIIDPAPMESQAASIASP